MNIKLKYSKIIPFPRFYVCTIFNCIFRHPKYKNRKLSKITYNHEMIHVEQQLDFVGGIEKLYILGGIIFYMTYFIEWLIKLIISGFTFGKVKAYRSISFEQESYQNERNLNYRNNRKRFCWLKNVFKLVK
jgi:hypothetical protein